jgi:Acyl-CoA thioester hydrolase/BAAT N-terminal region
MGLFWSLQPVPGQKRGLRFMKRNVNQPTEVHLAVSAGHQATDYDVVDHPRRLTRKIIYRRYAATDLISYNVRAGTLRAKLHLPPGRSHDGTIKCTTSLTQCKQRKSAISPGYELI